MKKRTMVTIIKTLNDVPYQEAMKELIAVGDPKATVQRSPFGWKIGLMGWTQPEQEFVPVHNPVPKPVDKSVDNYVPNMGNVVSFEELLAS